MNSIRMTFRTSALPSLLACAMFACSSGNGTPATGSGGHGGTTGAAGSGGTGGTTGAGGSTGGASGATGAGGAAGGAGGAAGGAGGQAGGNGGAGGAAVDGGTDAATDAGGTVKVYDLQTDWSDAKNPNDPWTIYFGTDVAKNFMNWNGEQGQNSYAGAASGTGHIPMAAKISLNKVEAELAMKGDLLVHAQDEGGGHGFGQARIVWTAPAAGTIDVDGTFFLARTVNRRADVYTVTVAGMQKAMATVAYNAFTRQAPSKVALKALPVMKGDTVELQITHAMMCDACSSSPCDGSAGHPTCADFIDYTWKVTLTSQ